MPSDESFRPHLQVATFCEKILEEKDGALTLVRMIDRLTHHGQEAEMQPFPFSLALAVVFKSGFMRGRATITVCPVSPTGKVLPALTHQVHFEGDERGAGLALHLTFVFEEEGLYWFDVRLNEELVTRVPMRILYQQVSARIPFP
jgi:hypothetical protein